MHIGRFLVYILFYGFLARSFFNFTFIPSRRTADGVQFYEKQQKEDYLRVMEDCVKGKDLEVRNGDTKVSRGMLEFFACRMLIFLFTPDISARRFV